MSVKSNKAKGIWDDDLLGRQADALFLKQFLVRRIEERSEEGRKKSYVLNLDAGWGHGKTFFLTRLKRELEDEGFLAVYVNAWEDDHAEDPMIAVMAAIDDAIAPRLKRKKALTKTWETAKTSFKQIAVTATTHGLKKLGSRYLGDGVDIIRDIWASGGDVSGTKPTLPEPKASDTEENVGDQVAEALSEGVEKLIDRYGEEALSRFRKSKSSSASFKDNLTRFLNSASHYKDLKVPLFVLVDELDRCRPSYAIELLERIKHLFEADNVVFIVATDSGQLRHAIKAVYGESFESGRYLLRFFDRSYVFEDPSMDAFVRTMFVRSKGIKACLSSPLEDEHEWFFSSVMRYFGMSLRDAEQCFDYLRTVATIWPHKVKLELIYLLPLIVAFQQGDEGLLSALSRFSIEDLRKHLERFKSRDWEFSFPHREEGSFQARTRTVAFSQLLLVFLGVAKEPLNTSTSRSGTSLDSRWINRIFQNEFAIIHGHSYQPGSPPKSLVSIYPEMVRNAGRISAIEEGLSQSDS